MHAPLQSIFTTWSINTSVVSIIGKDYVAVAPLFNCTLYQRHLFRFNHYERYYLSKETDFIISKGIKSPEKATIRSIYYLQNPKMYQ